MTCSLENVLSDAKSLVERLRNHDNAAEVLIEQTTSLNKRVEAMKQYQEEIESLNQVARHRPRSSLVMGIQQENRQIRDLQQENKELRTSLEEHQSAIELIMTKYREQVFRLLMASKKDDPAIVTQLKEQHTTEMQAHIDKINEMATVMRKAIEVDEGRLCEDEERIKQLELENSGLRELLGISREAFLVLTREEASDSTSLSALLTSADISLRKSVKKTMEEMRNPSTRPTTMTQDITEPKRHQLITRITPPTTPITAVRVRRTAGRKHRHFCQGQTERELDKYLYFS
uniref:FGFR1 oncogene partner 2 homolog n=5 Tax=Salmoninae TaxID=504568 RepID=A0A8C7Q662_ONCMY